MLYLIHLDIPGVVVEFLEVAVHVLLHSRKLYPEGIFHLKKKYGVPVHVSCNSCYFVKIVRKLLNKFLLDFHNFILILSFIGSFGVIMCLKLELLNYG